MPRNVVEGPFSSTFQPMKSMAISWAQQVLMPRQIPSVLVILTLLQKPALICTFPLWARSYGLRCCTWILRPANNYGIGQITEGAGPQQLVTHSIKLLTWGKLINLHDEEGGGGRGDRPIGPSGSASPTNGSFAGGSIALTVKIVPRENRTPIIKSEVRCTAIVL